MARASFQGTFRDGQGNIIVDGLVSVYDANTTTPSTLYAASTGGTSVNSVLSDSKGYFIFYIDSTDYPLGSEKFDIVLSKQAYLSQTYEDISIGIGFAAWDKDYNDLINTPDIDSLVPAQGTSAGKVLGTNGTNVLWMSGVPSGGSATQVLTKNSGDDYDASWAAIPESASIIETQVFM